jgi:hypothetical protein
MMNGVKTQLAQQRRRLRIAALHVQRRPFAAFLIIFAQLVEFTRTPATLRSGASSRRTSYTKCTSLFSVA